VDDALNWLLQGSLVALATLATLRVAARLQARSRYVVVWVALVSIVLLPVAPILWIGATLSPPARAATAAPPSIVSIPTRWWTSAAIVAALWALWCTVYVLRVSRAALALRRVRRGCQPFPVDVEARLANWMRMRPRGRRARLMLSDCVRSAAVLGVGSPSIVVSPSLLDQLTTDELDRVLIHEWAHVQRRDDFANSAQLVVGAIAGWHPAVAWLTRLLRLEREVACDEMAIAVTGSARRYAACLTKLASLPQRRMPAVPALAALSSSNVHLRVVRILSVGDAPAPGVRRAVTVAIALLLAAVAASVSGVRVVAEEVPGIARMVSAAAMHAAPTLEVQPSPAARAAVAQATEPARVKPRPLARTAPVPWPGVSQSVESAAPIVKPFVQELPAPQRTVEAKDASRGINQPLPTVETVGRVFVSASRSDGAEFPATVGEKSPSPWGVAADAGVAVGRGSQKAAVVTAGFFSRFGKKVAASF